MKSTRLVVPNVGACARVLMLWACAVGAVTTHAHGVDTKKDPCEPVRLFNRGAYSFTLENDAYGGNKVDSDRFYTNGLKLTWVSPTLKLRSKNPCGGELLNWVEDFNDFMVSLAPDKDKMKDARRNIVLGIGQAMYTPRGTLRDVPTLIKEDRPYAGWLYFTYGLNARVPSANDGSKTDHLHSIELNAGVVGPAAHAKQLQSWWHVNVIGKPVFKGWDNQLKNEIGLQAAYERKYRMFRDCSGGLEHDLIWHWGGSVGNVQSYANAGVEIRVGNTVPDDFGTSPIRPGGNSNARLADATQTPASPCDRGGIESGIHLFAAFNAKAVVRDIFLDGNTFRESHSVDKKRFVGDAVLGGVARYKRVALHLSYVSRSREFATQIGRQRFGSAIVSYEVK